MKKRKGRLQYIDIARGISILLMIVAHVLEFRTSIKRRIIFSFHMPLFILVSGYFYKEKSFKQEIKDLVFHLLIPSVTVVFIVSFIKNIKDLDVIHSIIESFKTILVGYSFQSNFTYNFYDAGVLWFIYMLIIIRIIFNINKKNI